MYEETVDDLFIEACEEDAEIEEGYFSDTLKYPLDREIDEDINNSMNSIFNGEGLNLDDAIVNLLDLLQIEVDNSDSEQAKLYIADDEFERGDDRISSSLYDWVDDDDPDKDDNEFNYTTNDTGEYNVGYDSIFGDN